MSVKYRTSKYDREKITQVEVVKETAKMITVIIPADRWNPAREDKGLKRSTYYCYHDTWEQARDYLLSTAEASVERYTREKQKAETLIGNIKALKKPE